jgi:hypothetical protein
MITGDIKKIDLSISLFEQMITNGNLSVDKSIFIENFLNETSSRGGVKVGAILRRFAAAPTLDMHLCSL